MLIRILRIKRKYNIGPGLGPFHSLLFKLSLDSVQPTKTANHIRLHDNRDGQQAGPRGTHE
eukprot:11956798-Heterocapsa_arctica.AAC.1